MEIFNEEGAYDNEIRPLMQKIIKICNKKGIPMIASFTFENCPDRGPGRCTTLINDIENRKDDDIQNAFRAVFN